MLICNHIADSDYKFILMCMYKYIMLNSGILPHPLPRAIFHTNNGNSQNGYFKSIFFRIMGEQDLLMSKNSPPFAISEMPEAFVSSTEISRAVSRAAKAGKLRKLAPRLYARNLTDAPEAVVRRNLWSIVAGYFPGALLADRTAFTVAPEADGSLFLVAQSGQGLILPGCALRPRRGRAPLPSDRPFLDEGLHLSSTARAYLENARPSRSRGGRIARTLSRCELEERLEGLIRRSGEAAAARLRGEIRAVGAELDLPEEAAELEDIIGALLGERQARLRAPAAAARQRGRPYDPDRLELFQALHAELRDAALRRRPEPERDPEADAALAFYEAYFSNYIEGTEFTVQEAADIVFRGAIPARRVQDAHDVLSTWQVVSDRQGMSRIPRTTEDFTTFLRERHAAIMARRPEVGPGVFKERQNRVGLHVFVAPELVAGTLARGFGLWRSLETPFQRAVFVHFLVAEVHPFDDGNGRVARIMMNAELAAGGEERIVVPTVYRDDYLTAVRALSVGGRPGPLIEALEHAQRWTAAVDWSTVETARRELERCNAFLTTGERDATGRGLRMPG